VLDVRDESEYAAGHIPDVVNIPLGELPRRLAEIPKETPLVVHCQGGSRAGIAASLLAAHGVADVRNLEGGYRRWRAEETDAPPVNAAPRK
jgi:hydroxyacylglutathione hydrolase